MEMTRLKGNGDTLDRLSGLPDSLILEILSFLDMRDVVKTTLLSKRWKYLWIKIPCLKFQFEEQFDDECEYDFVKFRNFVNRALMLWRGTYLRKFQIADSRNNDLNNDVNLWILFAKERKVEELIIYSSVSPSQCLYECSSLRKLTLVSCRLKTDGNVQWDSLNSLELSNGIFSEDWITQVFSSSPQLETFKFRCGRYEGVENMTIRSNSLKTLFIDKFYYESSVLTISAPNLAALEFSGQPYSKYLLTNISSLTKVYLGLELDSYSSAAAAAVVEEALSQIYLAIQHAVTVTLSADCFQMLGVMKGIYPVLPMSNVELLEIASGLTEDTDLLVLLENFPNLNMLIFEWTFGAEDYGKPFKFINNENYIISQANILKSNLLQLMTVKIIIWDMDQPSIFEFIEFLLKHAPVIEKMVIQTRGCQVSKNMILAAQKVVSLQRCFPSVELILC